MDLHAVQQENTVGIAKGRFVSLIPAIYSQNDNTFLLSNIKGI